MELYAGTSGFSCPEWKGPFYPAELADDELLAYYARLPVVEINNTSCRMPRADRLARRAERVPDAWRGVYVFFEHEKDGAVPSFALRMAARFPNLPALAHPITEATSRWP